VATLLTTEQRRTAFSSTALSVGLVFFAVGIAGFVPAITAHDSPMSGAGQGSVSELLGVFRVSPLHNVLHLLFGLAGIALSRDAGSARAYLLGGGVFYLVLWTYGAVIDHSDPANFVPLNNLDDWLHQFLFAFSG
jgi:hypothetical protein